jgi:hypothetical protein
MSVPADREDTYAVVVPTLADSTATDGLVMSTFFVRARAGFPGVYFDAAPDSGYSVDNLEPAVPTGLVLQGEVLAWNDPLDPDFDYFTVYRSDSPVLDGTATTVGHTTGTSLGVAADGPSYYFVTATDFAGNESEAAQLDAVSDTPDAPPARFALHGNHPNPFNPATTIRFELGAPAPVRLAVFDMSGRLVRHLVDGDRLGAGRHDRTWDGRDGDGRSMAAGVYLYRLEAGDFRRTQRMTLVK